MKEGDRLRFIGSVPIDTSYPARVVDGDGAPVQSDFTLRPRLLVALTVVALALPACGSLPPASQTASPEPIATAAGTAAPSGQEEPVAFTSSIYPYSLVLPREAMTVPVWRPATDEWDGVQRIDSGGALVDGVTVDDGLLFLYGMPWTGDVQAFADRVHANAVEHHDCSSPPLTTEETEIAGAPAWIHTMKCEGVAPVVRVAMLHEGYGLVAAELLNAEGSGPVNRLLERLGRLTWIDR